MNIVIAGDGEVGMHLAEALVRSNHDITLVDPHEELLKMMESHSDLMTITGDSTSTDVLLRANVKHADLVIAVLHDEHINLLTGIIAKKLGAKKVIARVNTSSFASCLLPRCRSSHGYFRHWVYLAEAFSTMKACDGSSVTPATACTAAS